MLVSEFRKNTKSSMMVILFGILILVRWLSANAANPMELTLLGITIRFR